MTGKQFREAIGGLVTRKNIEKNIDEDFIAIIAFLKKKFYKKKCFILFIKLNLDKTLVCFFCFEITS